MMHVTLRNSAARVTTSTTTMTMMTAMETGGGVDAKIKEDVFLSETPFIALT